MFLKCFERPKPISLFLFFLYVDQINYHKCESRHFVDSIDEVRVFLAVLANAHGDVSRLERRLR